MSAGNYARNFLALENSCIFTRQTRLHNLVVYHLVSWRQYLAAAGVTSVPNVDDPIGNMGNLLLMGNYHYSHITGPFMA